MTQQGCNTVHVIANREAVKQSKEIDNEENCPVGAAFQNIVYLCTTEYVFYFPKFK
jgi:hypothetical protein